MTVTDKLIRELTEIYPTIGSLLPRVKKVAMAIPVAALMSTALMPIAYADGLGASCQVTLYTEGNVDIDVHADGGRWSYHKSGTRVGIAFSIEDGEISSNVREYEGELFSPFDKNAFSIFPNRPETFAMQTADGKQVFYTIYNLP